MDRIRQHDMTHRIIASCGAILSILLATACTGESDDGPDELVVGACFYESPFSGAEECREFSGEGWREGDAISACQQLSGVDDMGGGRCPETYSLGTCVLDDQTEQVTTIFIYGDDPADCGAQATGCELFGGGRWVPSGPCGDPEPVAGGNVFVQPTLECQEPLAGEEPGQSEGGQVCTWQSIAGSTEEGRRFSDYASCDIVRSQRPYYPSPAAVPPAEPDTRLQDPAYVAELDWVKSQVEASGCICCHSTEETPRGPSNWYIEASDNWMNSFYDTGLALGAGFVASDSFGAFPAEHNNGFERGIISGFPSTDPQRMQAFFVAELEHRGLGPEDFASTPPFGGPLVQQLSFQPEACESGERVGEDGVIAWTGGPARYVYVLEAGGQSPTVPPNLDLPPETLWRLDVPFDQVPVVSGDIRYGTVPANLVQRFPAAGEPAALVPGTEYYLYVSRDVGQPITRCLFTY